MEQTHVFHICFMLQKQNEDFLLSMKRQIQWHIRYFNLSLSSLYTEVIKTCVGLFM